MSCLSQTVGFCSLFLGSNPLGNCCKIGLLLSNFGLLFIKFVRTGYLTAVPWPSGIRSHDLMIVVYGFHHRRHTYIQMQILVYFSLCICLPYLLSALHDFDLFKWSAYATLLLSAFRHQITALNMGPICREKPTSAAFVPLRLVIYKHCIEKCCNMLV